MIDLLDRFVPVVDTPSNYSGYGVNVDHSRLQYKLVEQVLGQTVYHQISGAQGLYVITPSGRLIAGTTEHSNPDRVLTEMRNGLEAYSRLPKSERLLPREPEAGSDKVETHTADAKAPEGGLVLRMVTRGLTESGVGRDDTRHNLFYKLDRVWLTREQARSFVPAVLRVGEKTGVRGPGLAVILRLHLGVFVQPNQPWNGEDVKSAELVSEIMSVKGDVVEIRFEGAARYEANSQYNQRRYTPRLLGRASYNTRRLEFDSFEMVAVGTHTLGNAGEDARVFGRGPQSIPLGVLFTLNGTNANDQVPPEHLRQYEFVVRTTQR